MTAQVRHPSWCLREDCTVTGARGSHCSRPIVVDCGPFSDLTLSVRLLQFLAIAGYAHSGVVVIDVDAYTPDNGPDSPESNTGFVVDAQHALALGHALISAGRAAQPGQEVVPISSGIGWAGLS